MANKGRTVNRLTQIEFFKLAEYVRQLEMKGFRSYIDLAAAATTACGFQVTESSVRSACQMLGKELPRAAARKEALAIIARDLMHLYGKVGEPVSAELRALVQNDIR